VDACKVPVSQINSRFVPLFCMVIVTVPVESKLFPWGIRGELWLTGWGKGKNF
jgi:hypothetical protein